MKGVAFLCLKRPKGRTAQCVLGGNQSLVWPKKTPGIAECAVNLLEFFRADQPLPIRLSISLVLTFFVSNFFLKKRQKTFTFKHFV